MVAAVLNYPGTFALVPSLRDSRGRTARGPFCTFNKSKAWRFAKTAAKHNPHDDICVIRWPAYKEVFGETPPPAVLTIPQAALRDILFLLRTAEAQIAADNEGKEQPRISRQLRRGIALLSDCLPG
jgi:hypothetical protein